MTTNTTTVPHLQGRRPRSLERLERRLPGTVVKVTAKRVVVGMD